MTHRLAVVGREHADAQVEFLAADGDLDPAVLGAALLGDVDLRHDLDAGEHGAQQPAGRAVALDQHAVDPVADADPVLERLDVDVGGPQLHRLLIIRCTSLTTGALVSSTSSPPPSSLAFFGLGEVDGRVGELLQHRVDRFVALWP